MEELVISAYERSVLAFRAQPEMGDLVKVNFLEEDLGTAVSRYRESPEFAEVLSRLGSTLKTGTRLLDLGVGRGLTSLALARSGVRVTAVESNPSEVVGVGALAKFPDRASLPLTLVRGNIMQLPFADGSLDVVFCRSVLHHIEGLAQGLAEIRRVLIPGGLFVAVNEHIKPPLSRGRTFLASHPAVRYGVNEHAYFVGTYWRFLRIAGFRRIRWFRYGSALEREAFQRATESNPFRACLSGAPLLGPLFASVFYAAHVLKRRKLFLLFPPERALPCVCVEAIRP